jgi:tetratricopeptide (TPR) repeat protein
VSGAGSTADDGSGAPVPSPNISDASAASPQPGTSSSSKNSSSSSSSSSSTPTIRDDPYSPFDASKSGLDLRRIRPDDPPPAAMTVMSLDTINQEDCGTWTQVGVQSSTVSMVRLEVPGKARGVYQKACGELKKKKLEAAEHEAKRAVDAYHNYPAAWVLLGQAFYKGNDMDHAQDACTRASEIDPGYVAPYLCLAAVADHERDWDEAQTQSDHALSLSPLKNAYALYYKAEAAYHKGQLREAEKDALDAAGADTNHELPEIELLLARVYAAMKDESEAAIRVRNYLKFAHEPSDAAAVNSQLAAINKGQ